MPPGAGAAAIARARGAGASGLGCAGRTAILAARASGFNEAMVPVELAGGADLALLAVLALLALLAWRPPIGVTISVAIRSMSIFAGFGCAAGRPVPIAAGRGAAG